jgi:hypothetical protein
VVAFEPVAAIAAIRRTGFVERPATVVAMKERLNPCSRRSLARPFLQRLTIGDDGLFELRRPALALLPQSCQRRSLQRRASQRHFYGPFTSVVQKIALTAIVDQADNST